MARTIHGFRSATRFGRLKAPCPAARCSVRFCSLPPLPPRRVPRPMPIRSTDRRRRRRGSRSASPPPAPVRDRFPVQGAAAERYLIRITNPTARRIEAVVSVDGLDVIDGENGDLHKRGYVVPAYGETRIEGFRTSQADVATFRFSSVHDSYAGMKGKARNVGVVAVALFEEQAQPEEQQV